MFIFFSRLDGSKLGSEKARLNQPSSGRRRWSGGPASLWILAAIGPVWPAWGGDAPPEDPALRTEMGRYPSRIIYETFRENNWEFYISTADGSRQWNVTQTPDIDEHYPKVSPDGTKIAFEVHRGLGREAKKSVWYMDLDGKNRVLVEENAMQPAWSPDGKTIAYMKGPDVPGDYFVCKTLCFYDISSGKHAQHPNQRIENLINLNYTPDGKWIVATVVAAMGFGQPIVAIETGGDRVVKLVDESGSDNIFGCRPDLTLDGRQMAWSVEDLGREMWVCVADLDFSGPEPKAVHWRKLQKFPMPTHEIYHVDWSPDAQYVAFSTGHAGGKMLGAVYVTGREAPGWDICVEEVAHPERYFRVTTDGKSNKEPDWIPTAPARAATEKNAHSR